MSLIHPSVSLHSPSCLSVFLIYLLQCDFYKGPRGGIWWWVLWCVTSVFCTVTHLLLSCSPIEWVMHVCKSMDECACLLSLYFITSSMCLDLGVWGFANPSRECQLPGYSDRSHSWKALQRIRGGDLFLQLHKREPVKLSTVRRKKLMTHK